MFKSVEDATITIRTGPALVVCHQRPNKKPTLCIQIEKEMKPEDAGNAPQEKRNSNILVRSPTTGNAKKSAAGGSVAGSSKKNKPLWAAND